MVKHLHRDFLVDRDRYDAGADYWHQLCRDVLRGHSQGDPWQPFFGIHRDASHIVVEEGSIYSLHSEKQKKAISIEQYLPKSEDVEISAMTDTFGEDVLPNPIIVLTIWCALSEESAVIARQLIEAWIREDTTRVQIEDLIAKLTGRKNLFEGTQMDDNS